MTVRIQLGRLGQSEIANSSALGPFSGELRIGDQEPIFIPIGTFLTSLMGFAALADIYHSAEPAGAWGPDHVMVLDAMSAGQRLVCAAHELPKRLLRNWWPSEFVFKYTDLPPDLTDDKAITLGEIAPFLQGAMQAMFVSFYEDHVGVLKTKFGESHKGWPGSWRFGWVVRNALSHGGKAEIRKDTSVSWKGLTFTKADHMRPVILVDLWPGDLIMLMKDMQDELEALSRSEH